ncbi:MAG: hypothetical protein OXE78_11745 [Gammaproteobacteria bacterium]|nr:hypothetical protein [Gammaproteobacteria bacterium]
MRVPPPARTITVLLRSGTQEDRYKLEAYRPFLKKLAKLNSVE